MLISCEAPGEYLRDRGHESNSGRPEPVARPIPAAEGDRGDDSEAAALAGVDHRAPLRRDDRRPA